MAEKMTAVVLIILTMIVCAAVPALMIMLTTIPTAKVLFGIEDLSNNLVFYHLLVKSSMQQNIFFIM